MYKHEIWGLGAEGSNTLIFCKSLPEERETVVPSSEVVYDDCRKFPALGLIVVRAHQPDILRRTSGKHTHVSYQSTWRLTSLVSHWLV